MKNSILLMGNPNTGKTTLYNKITGGNEHVGNWHGVTVAEKVGCFKFKDKKYSLVDLPGIYSLDGLSFEEKVAIDYAKKNKDCKVINICDLNNLERNLYLTLCLIDEGFDVVLAVNSTLKKPLCSLNEKKLSCELGIDVVQINAESGDGIDKLLDKSTSDVIQKQIKDRSDNLINFAEEKYEKIDKICEKCLKKSGKIYGKSKIDKILLNRFFAPIVFLAIMTLIFYFTFFLIGKPLSDFLNFVLENTLGKWINLLFSNIFGSSHWITMLVSEAIIGGIGIVLSFLPQIVLLFLFLSILEESGYISRVAFVFDDLLSKIGLSGKCIYTLLLGFGCSATAILTARNMDDKNAKLKTILSTPFLSCSARLPIYLAVGGTIFGESNIFVILLLYLIGILVCILTSSILDRTILKSKEQSFILEFPPYRMLNLKKVVKVLWDNTKSFIVRIGGILISMNVIVWILSNFSFTFSYVKTSGNMSMLESIAKFISPIFSPLGFSSWGIVVALLVGIVAKEGVVSSMLLLCGGNLSMIFSKSSAIFISSQAGVLAFLVFCLLYVPCLSTIAVMRKEIGKKWTWFAIFFQMIIAYFFAMAIYNLCKLCELFGTMKILLFISVVFVIIFLFVKFLFKVKKKHCKNCNSCKR